MQRLFTADGPWPTPWLDRTLPLIATIAVRFASRTIFTRFIPPAQPEDRPGAWQGYYERWREVTRERIDPRLLDLVPELAALSPPAVTFDKGFYSAFTASSLPALLRRRGTDTLVVTGAETDICVLATVLGAIDHGFRIMVIEDAVCSASDAGHEAVLSLFRGRFSSHVSVATTEQLLSDWRAATRPRA